MGRATAAWCNASELELNIKFTDWPNATKTKEKANEEKCHIKHVTPYDGGGGGRLCRRLRGVGGHWHCLDLGLAPTNHQSRLPL